MKVRLVKEYNPILETTVWRVQRKFLWWWDDVGAFKAEDQPRAQALYERVSLQGTQPVQEVVKQRV